MVENRKIGSYADSKIWDFLSTAFGIFHIIDASASHVYYMRYSLKDFAVRGSLWSVAYGMALLLLIAAITAGVLLIYGILMVKPYLVNTYMILLGVTGVTAACLIAAFVAVIGYHAFFIALLIRIPFHMIGMITAYYTCKRLKVIIHNNRVTHYFNKTRNLQTIVENVPPMPRPLSRRFSSEPAVYAQPRGRSYSVV